MIKKYIDGQWVEVKDEPKIKEQEPIATVDHVDVDFESLLGDCSKVEWDYLPKQEEPSTKFTRNIKFKDGELQ